MANQQEMLDFMKMWKWLSAHPAHDQEYYMKHVAKLDEAWEKGCPLCHSAEGVCTNCENLWKTARGSLCQDMDSPLNKWRKTSVDDPDNRTYYANRMATLSMRAVKEM